MRRSSHDTFTRTLVVLAALSLAASAHAQQSAPATSPPAASAEAPPEPPPPESQPAEAPDTATTDLTPASIQARIDQATADSGLPATLKTELLTTYRQALDQLSLAATWSAKATEFQTGREEAPALLDEVRAALARATSQPAVPESQPASAALGGLPEDASLDQLSQRLDECRATLSSRAAEADKLQSDADNRNARLLALPDQVAAAGKRLEQIDTLLATASPAGQSPLLIAARNTLLLTQRAAVQAELQSYEQERRFYDARSELLGTRRALAKLRASEAQNHVAALDALVTQRRQQEIERQQQMAAEELERTPGPLRTLAETNKSLADEMAEVEPRIRATQELADNVNRQAAELADNFDELKQKVSQPVLRETLGPLMRTVRTRLSQLRGSERELQAHRARAVEVLTRSSALEEQRLKLIDREGYVRDELTKVLRVGPRAQGSWLEDLIRARLDRQYELVVALKSTYDAYGAQLAQLLTDQATLLNKVSEFNEFINAHVLWIRSASPLYRAHWPADGAALAQAAPRLLIALGRDVRTHAVGYAAALLALLALFWLKTRAGIPFQRLRQSVAHPYTDRYRYTLAALGLTFLVTLPIPLTLLALGLRLPLAVDIEDASLYPLASAVSTGLRAVAIVAVILGFLRQMARPGGLADCHFRWVAAAQLRREATWLLGILAPAAFIMVTAERVPDVGWRDLVGRSAFIISLSAIAVFLRRILHPTRGVMAAWLRLNDDGNTWRLRSVWYPAAVALPLVLAGASFIGYHYTAGQFMRRISRSGWLILLLLILHQMLVRWLFVAQRKLAIEQARKKRAAALEARAADDKSDAPPPLEESAFDLVSMGAQTRKLLRSLVAIGLVLALWFTWSDLLPALNFMNNVHLWSYTVEVPAAGATGVEHQVAYVTLAHLALALVIALITAALARNIPGLLEITVLTRLPLDRGGRFAITAVARYAIVTIGIIVAFGALAVKWSSVQWLVAAVSVGLGFGLQEIFANFVSGLMLLFERPIRIGDTVTVGGVTGTVTRIRIRATTITDWDRKELIIPNREFITGQVVNWTLSDSTLRAVIPVGIAYGSDTNLAQRVLTDVARAEPLVLADPVPRVLFLGFGESTLNFDLRVYVAQVDHLLEVQHNLHMAIDRAFREAGIEIAVPQRDVHIRSIEGPLDLRPESTPAPAERPAVRPASERSRG